MVDVGGAVGLGEGEVEQEYRFDGVVEGDPGGLEFMGQIMLDEEGKGRMGMG